MVFAFIAEFIGDGKFDGWFRALGLLFLFIVPFLTVWRCVVGRGRGMAEGQDAQLQRSWNGAVSHIRYITAEEYAILKSKALAWQLGN
ncbi:hypothetical protein [Glutamicibacter sp. Je.9.36]|uniref:hypothetical protein n=1 Tax=Glutamicibacter sp. Je.9.36 TaxID=3142837 RepID=UPI003DA83ECB